ncbi:lipocalin-15 [Chanos chanos]|uniref:Lipocalin-15 n=1 Tax=Chanos chanos TaxID=29144 RepID=A0A6J2WR04_CHACN|nr:prostaglandin-H2 D-isomerase-like [Chanos chanos]
MVLKFAVLFCLIPWTYSLLTQNNLVQPQKHFDQQKLAGEWYRVGLAYDSPSFAKYRDKVLISKGVLVPNAEGGVNLTMWNMSPLGCMTASYAYEKTDVPGHFIYFSKRHSIMKDITVVDSNYTEYILVVKYKNINKEFSQVSLFGRTHTLRQELIEKFRQLSLSLGFSEASILTPSAIDPCPLQDEHARNTTEPAAVSKITPRPTSSTNSRSS